MFFGFKVLFPAHSSQLAPSSTKTCVHDVLAKAWVLGKPSCFNSILDIQKEFFNFFEKVIISIPESIQKKPSWKATKARK